MKDVCIRREFESTPGETKVFFDKIGVMFEKNGKEYLRLYHIPGALIYLFENKPRDVEATWETPKEEA